MKKSLLVALLVLAATGSVFSQEFRTGYFLENYTYAYRLNAAAPIEGDSYFFGAIGLGNISAEAHSNLALTSFLSPLKNADGSTSLVFPLGSLDFTLEQALAGFSSNNEILANANINILTFGHQTDISRWSVELNARANAYAGMPIDIFSALKTAQLNGLKDWHDTYSFAGLHINADSYVELAIGYSRKVGDLLTVGGRLKGLVGAGYAALDMDASISPGQVKDVKANLDASIGVSSPVPISLPSSQQGSKKYIDFTGYEDFSQVRFADFFGSQKGPAGWGLGVDVGLTFEPLDGLYITAAANDLGFINWKGNVGAAWHIDSEIGDDWKDFLKLEDTSGRFTSGLNYSVNAGVKYKMPFYDRLSVGLLGTLQKHYKEARLGIDITPIDFLSLAASGAIGSQGFNLGAALNIKFRFLNFFIGTDAVFFNYTPQMIPLDKVNSMVTTGLVITI